MKSKSLIMLLLSIGFGIIAAIGFSQVMNNRSIAKDNDEPRGPVLLAMAPLDARALLTEENVKIENWPTNIIPPDAITSMDEVTDMVTLNRLSKGMPLIKTGVQHKNISTGLTIPEGMKVVAVRLPADSTIGNLLQPSNKVDVIGVFKQRDKTTNHTTTTSRTFLKALTVYSVNNKTSTQVEEKSSRANGTSIIGLLVTQKQSEALVFVQDTGSIKLVLRGDDAENDGSVEQLEDLEKDLLAEEDVETAPEKDMGELRIWRGPQMEKTKFGQDGSPKSTTSSGSGSNSGEMSNSNGRGDSGNRGDSDRGIDDDQYRGE